VAPTGGPEQARLLFARKMVEAGSIDCTRRSDRAVTFFPLLHGHCNKRFQSREYFYRTHVDANARIPTSEEWCQLVHGSQTHKRVSSSTVMITLARKFTGVIMALAAVSSFEAIVVCWGELIAQEPRNERPAPAPPSWIGKQGPTRRSTTRRSPITPTLSGSILETRPPSTAAAMPGRTKRNMRRQSPITPRPSSLTPRTPDLTITAAPPGPPRKTTTRRSLISPRLSD
jgi:hypothetical protein